MQEDIKNELLKAQESEMETVIIYKYLASRAKDPEIKNILLKISSDEGKHAGIIRKYTGKTLQRKNKPALRFRIITRLFGLKMILRMMLTSEQKNADAYAPVAKQNPVMREILKDERKHCQLISQMIEKLSEKKSKK